MSMYTQIQTLAIMSMGRNRPEYNEGVLEMLGKGELARTFMARKSEVAELVAARDAMAGDTFEFLLNPSPEQAAVQRAVDEAVIRCNQAWEPIQQIIDEAKSAAYGDWL